MANTKITAHVYEPLWINFMRQSNALFLKRDAFLNHVVSSEVRHLASDLDEKRLSAKAKRYISGKLKSMGSHRARPVNIVVQQECAKSLNEIVARSNLVRDSFINRLFFLLRASDSFLDYFGFPLKVDPASEGAESVPMSPLKALEALRDDPLHYLRTSAKQRFDCGLYTLPFPEPLHGFSCYLDENQIPETPAFARKKADYDKILASLEPLEKAAFSQTNPKPQGSDK